MFQTNQKPAISRSPRDKTSLNSASGTKHMIANRNAGLTSGQRSPANKINDSAHNVTQAMIHNGSADTGSHSMMSVTKHLMPQANDASVEDYKMELK